ncbi:MAG: tetratricopeptide repeat protein, partial [Bacteroidota bacterium]|nr:tetratricopeptide repeat protein [Bacteroidota bacterium]
MKFSSSFHFPVTLVMLFCFTVVFAQPDPRVEWVNSQKLIKEGVRYHDDEQYDKAIARYKKIHRSDSLYSLALYELSFSYIQNKQYEEALAAAREGLALQDDNENLFYLQVAEALDELERREEAIAVYDEAIKKYPYWHRPRYEKGVTLERLHRDLEAVESFQQAVRLNPLHALSHYQLGRISAENDKISMAFLSLQFYLFLKGSDAAAGPGIELLQKVAQRTLEVDPDSIVEISSHGNDFKDLDRLLAAKIALNKEYKSQIKLSYDMVKQLQLFYEKLEYKENDKGFWMQFYVPYFIMIRDKGYYEPFVFHIMSAIDNKQVQAGVKKNKKKIGAMITTLGTKLINDRSEGPEGVESPFSGYKHFYNDDGTLSAAGETKTVAGEENSVGEWYYFYSHGTIRSKGKWNDASERTGEWTFYYTTGGIHEKLSYKEGKPHGAYVSYYPNGALEQKLTYEEGEVEGEVQNYYPVDQLESLITFKDNERNGKYISYYSNGRIWVDANYKNGELDGPGKTYYNTGQLMTEFSYKENNM